MNQEIERKFCLSKAQAEKFQNEHANKLYSTHEITQFYLVNNEKQKLTVGANGWVVSVNGFTLTIPLLNGEIEKINQLKLSDEQNLIAHPETSCRFRFKRDIKAEDTKIIFTFKIDLRGKLFEFEYEISTFEKIDIELLCEDIKSKVHKFREIYSFGEYMYELDLFQDFELIILEIEFKSETEAMRFIPAFAYDYEATGVKRFSNLQLSLLVEAQSSVNSPFGNEPKHLSI